MIFASLQPDDSVWVYNKDTKLYVKLKVVSQNSDNKTTVKLTDVEQSEIPEGAIVTASLRVEKCASSDGATETIVVEVPRFQRLLSKIKFLFKVLIT